MKRSLYAFLVFSLLSFSAHAQQTSCAQNLRLARATYESGRLHEVRLYLKSCIESSVKQERVEAYKLLCLTYIYLEEPELADQNMLELLRTDHYFEINTASDPAEFVALYNRFRTKPIYRVGAKIGANVSHPKVVSYLPSNELSSEYKFGFAFQGGLAADIPLKYLAGKLTLHPELIFLMRTFKYNNEGSYTDIMPNDDEFTRRYETNGLEKHAWISLPVSLLYQLKDKKLKPYVGLGMSADYLFSAQNTFLRTKENATSLPEQSQDILSSRNKINLSAIASLGIRLKVSGGFAIAELRYTHGVKKLNDLNAIYSNLDRVNPTGGYVDGIFKINSLSFTLGYVYNRFNPKKLKN